MENFYSTLFIIGVSYAVITFSLGFIFDALNIGGDIDLDGDIPWFGLFKPINVVSFITVLGGTGMMLTGYFNPVLTFGISLLMALLVTFLVHRFTVIPLYKA